MRKIKIIVVTCFFYLFFLSASAYATSYYISPTGNDANFGTSTSTPWKTFEKAWTKPLASGDTLYLMDGTYTSQNSTNATHIIYPTINGQAGKYITVKALNDGKAIIDGQNTRIPVEIGQSWGANDPNPSNTNLANTPQNPYGNYFEINGIVAKNSSASVVQVNARNVTLRRVSAYNANPHDNEHVITIWSQGDAATPSNILVEDSIAAGSGRKMILAYDSYNNVVFRRNFAAWQWWLGNNFCQSYWPQADGIEVYPAAYVDQPNITNNSINENNIYFGLSPDYGTSLSPNPGLRAGNNYYGDISLGAGMRWDNTNHLFVDPTFDSNTCTYNGTQRPATCSSSTCIDKIGGQDSYRAGYVLGTFGNPPFQHNTFQDIFGWGSGGLGLIAGPWDSSSTDNKLIRATLVHNGQSTSTSWPIITGRDVDTTAVSLALFTTKTDLKIGNPSYTGGGAQLQNQYVSGILTSTPLWPWPMEDRIKTEFADPSLFQANGVQGQVWTNFSVTQVVCQNILLPNGAVSSCPTTQSPTNTPVPTSTLVPSLNPTIAIGNGDANGDGKVDGKDLLVILTNYNLNKGLPTDQYGDGLVNMLDLNVVLSVLAQTTPTPTPTPSGPTPTPAAPVYPLKASANKRYLVDQNNVPFLIIGDSAQAMIGGLSQTDADTYLSNRAAAGINAIWAHVLCLGPHYPSCRTDGSTPDGIVPFTTPNDLSNPNQAYFTRVDQMIQLAAKYNIMVLLDPIETIGWLDVLRTNGVTKDFNYGVYLGNRYKNFPNVLWLHGNDFQTWSSSSDDAVVQAVANGIKSVDPNHLQTVELDYPTSASLNDSSWSSIIGLDLAYSYYSTYDQVLREYNRSNFIPVYFMEGVYEYQDYEGGYTGPHELRAQEYWTQLSGAAGNVYGNAYIFRFNGWQNHLNDTGFKEFTYWNNFFASRPWYNLVPDQNHTVVTAGYGTYQSINAGVMGNTSDYATTARTTDGTLIVSYMPTSRTITVDMTKLSGSATARWYDPTNGTYSTISGSPFSNTGSRQFIPPSGNHTDGTSDWVLILQVN